jgi:DNA-binding NarL/FixJ family response regulator
MKILLALVEDNHALRTRLADNLAFFGEVEIVLACPSGETFLQELAKLPAERQPRVVLMDIELPGMTGIETTRKLKAQYPAIEVLMLTVFEDNTRLFDSVAAGATGYLLKDEPAAAIVEAIKELVAGGAPMSSVMARKMLAYFKGEKPTAPQPAMPAADFDLTEREVTILERLVAGDNYLQIGDKLFISPQTVKSHIKNIYKKMHVHTRAEAVRVALKNNMVKGE